MILFSWKEEPETRGDHMPCDFFRWALDVGIVSSKDGVYAYITSQHRDRKTKEWRPSHVDMYGFSFNINPKKWRFGHYHFYYDGPHCIFDLGPLSIQYGGNWDCKRCGLTK